MRKILQGLWTDEKKYQKELPEETIQNENRGTDDDYETASDRDNKEIQKLENFKSGQNTKRAY